MLSKRTTLFVFVLLAALIACSLPSNAATVVPATTPTPTITASASPSESPTQAPETQAQGDQPDAPPPTAAANPTVPGVTSPLTVEPTPTTASAPPQAGELAIREFRIDPLTVERGGQITLWWEVTGATEISITRLSERGGIYLTSIGANLDPVGNLSYSIPEDYINEISFILIVSDEAGGRVTQTVTTSIACPFETTLSGSCPISHAIVEAAHQPFEHGFMVWVAALSGDPAQIYVMYEDTTWRKYEDTWVDGETFDVGESPPDGSYQPEHGFGKVWAAEAEVSDKLGWATEPEVGYTADLEIHKCYFSHYVTGCAHIELPDGQVLYLETGWWVE